MIGRFFTKNGEIHRRTYRPNSMSDGGKVEWVAIMTSKGVLDQLSGGSRLTAMKLSMESTHMWYCFPFSLLISDPETQTTYFGSPFTPSQYGEAIPAELKITDRLVVDGVNYEIVNVDDPMGMGHHLEVEVKRLSSGQL